MAYRKLIIILSIIEVKNIILCQIYKLKCLKLFKIIFIKIIYFLEKRNVNVLIKFDFK